MEYQNYEDYMRQVLGYSSQNPYIYETYNYRGNPVYDNTYDRTSYVSEEEVSELYPEIYHIVNPMVCKACETIRMPISKEQLEQMTDEIYDAIEDTQTVVNVRVEVPKETKKTETRTQRPISKIEEIRNNRSYRDANISKISIENNVGNYQNSETRTNKESIDRANSQESETRVIRRPNITLRDLIKILILRQLLRRPNRPPVRPPRPPHQGGPGMPPPRPPYPGGRPTMGGPNQPPMQSRDYIDYFDF